MNQEGVTMWPCDRTLRTLPYLTRLMHSKGTRLHCWQFSIAKGKSFFYFLLILPLSLNFVALLLIFFCPFTPYQNDLQLLCSNVSKDTMQENSKCCRILFLLAKFLCLTPPSQYMKPIFVKYSWDLPYIYTLNNSLRLFCAARAECCRAEILGSKEKMASQQYACLCDMGGSVLPSYPTLLIFF